MRYLDVQKRRDDGSYSVTAEECMHMTPDQFIALHTDKDNARVFRDIREYSKHQWVNDTTLDVEYTTKILWKSYPVRLRLIVDPTKKSISYFSVGTDQLATVHGVWSTKQVTSNRTIVRFRQHMIVHHIPGLVNIAYFLRRRVSRALDDIKAS